MGLPMLLLLASVTATEPVKLAAPSFQAVGVDPAKAQFYSDFFAQQLASPDIRVTTTSEIAALIGIERQKQLLACDETSGSCLSELAGALGVDGVITGSVAKTETGSYAVAVKIISARDARPLSTAAARLKNEDAVLDFFSGQAQRMATDVLRALRPELMKPAAEAETQNKPPPNTIVEAAPSSTGSSKRWVPLAVGGALVVGGGTLYLLASGSANQIRDGSVGDEAAMNAAIQSGRQKESLSFALLGAGLGTAGAGGLLMAFGDDAHSKAWVPMAAGGALAVAGGVFYGLAKGTENSIRTGGPANASELSHAIQTGHGQENLAFGLGAAGVGALVTGGLELLLGRTAPAQISLGVSGKQGVLTVAGEFP